MSYPAGGNQSEQGRLDFDAREGRTPRLDDQLGGGMILFRALDDVRGRAAVVIGGHGIHSGLPSSGSGSMLLGSGVA